MLPSNLQKYSMSFPHFLPQEVSPLSQGDTQLSPQSFLAELFSKPCSACSLRLFTFFSYSVLVSVVFLLIGSYLYQDLSSKPPGMEMCCRVLMWLDTCH